jgi:hypothetical protein
MFQIPHDAVVPLSKFTEYLNETPRVYLDVELVASEVAGVDARYQSRVEQLKILMFATLGYRPNHLTRQVIITYLNAYGVPDKYTKVRGTDKDTVSQKYLLKAIEDGYCVDFLMLYVDMAKTKFYLERVNKVLERIRTCEVVKGNNGERLAVVPYTVTSTLNRRFSTANQNVIGFYKTLKTSMKAPKGYLLIGGDFPQIDGKGALYLYFKTALMLAIASKTNDSYLVYKELVRHVENLRNKHKLEQALNAPEYRDTSELEDRINAFDETVLPFINRAQREVYKVITLSTVYNKRTSPFRDTRSAIKNLSAAIESIGRYQMIQSLSKYLRTHKYPIVAKSRFGYSRPMYEYDEFRAYPTIKLCDILSVVMNDDRQAIVPIVDNIG